MAAKNALQRAQEDRRKGKSPSTQAGEFVREEMDSLNQGNPRIHSPKQAIAIGLSKARRAGVPLPPPAKGKASDKVRRQAQRDLKRASSSAKRSRTSSTSKQKASR